MVRLVKDYAEDATTKPANGLMIVAWAVTNDAVAIGEISHVPAAATHHS